MAPRPKSDLLNNIELLWAEASLQSQDLSDQKANSTFQRINSLMQDALSVEHAANDALPPESNQDTKQEIRSEDQDARDISALAALVQDAAVHDDHDAPHGSGPVSAPFEQVKAQMDDVSRLKPPQEGNYNISSVEYDFGQAFTSLVRHVVRDYIHNEVEAVIRNAISSELNAHFSQQHESSHDEEDKG